MAKKRVSQEQLESIQNMNLQELGQSVTSGEFSIADLRRAYSQMRDIAVKRVQRLTSAKNVAQFGKPNLYMENGEYFRKTKFIKGEGELLKEIADVSKFLQSKRSTITGLKETRETIIENMQEQGFEIDRSNYVQFLEFMKWFKSSEFAKKYDSDSPVVSEVFNSEKASPEDWREAFEKFNGYANEPAPVRQY